MESLPTKARILMEWNRNWSLTPVTRPKVTPTRSWKLGASCANISEWIDRLVKYMSKHIDGVVSEKIVRSGHSVQGNPEAIREIKRILEAYLKAR